MAKLKKKSLIDKFEGEVLRGNGVYEVVDEVGNGLTELNGILKYYKNKKVRITIEEIK